MTEVMIREYLKAYTKSFPKKVLAQPFGSLSTNKAVGKNKHLAKGRKKGAKKQVIDPYSKKD